MGLEPEVLGDLARRLPEITWLVEADGAKGRLLKAPEEYEPVIPDETDRVIVVAAFLSGVTLFGMIVAFFFGRDVVLGALRESLLAPSIAVTLTCLVLCAPPLLERLAELPYFVLPFLPPLLYAGLLLALERAQLFRKLRTVYGMLRASPADAGTWA